MDSPGGKPADGQIGAQPEWAFKGDGRCVVDPEEALSSPAFAEDGGEEAELAGLYVIDEFGNPWRVGYAIGNEFAECPKDSITEFWMNLLMAGFATKRVVFYQAAKI